jgi:hypothetical protein
MIVLRTQIWQNYAVCASPDPEKLLLVDLNREKKAKVDHEISNYVRDHVLLACQWRDWQ